MYINTINIGILCNKATLFSPRGSVMYLNLFLQMVAKLVFCQPCFRSQLDQMGAARVFPVTANAVLFVGGAFPGVALASLAPPPAVLLSPLTGLSKAIFSLTFAMRKHTLFIGDVVFNRVGYILREGEFFKYLRLWGNRAGIYCV